MVRRHLPLLAAGTGLLLVGAVLWLTISQSAPSDRFAVALPGKAAAAAVLPGATPPHREFTMVAVGDIMTDRSVGQAIRTHGVHSILEQVRGLTAAADVSFANLECPLSTVGPHDPRDCIFRARPDTVQVLVDGGFDIVSLANNHSMDAGRAALLQTMQVLDRHHIRYCGARREKAQSGRATYLEVGEGPVRVGFIGATDLSFNCGSYNPVAPDRANLIAEIKAARPHCDVLVVSLHWGEEYHSAPDQRQRDTAHAAIRAGADLILGHHPHVLEGIEVYQGKPILYSMGNFVFDQRAGERMESAIFHFRYIVGHGWQIFAKPIWIPRSRMGPVYPGAARRDEILSRLVHISRALGTNLQVKDGEAWLEVPAASAGVRS